MVIDSARLDTDMPSPCFGQTTDAVAAVRRHSRHRVIGRRRRDADLFKDHAGAGLL
jgi:hypothetical protein